MSLLCTTTSCATTNLPAQLDPCDLTPVQTSGLGFIFIKCDYQFTDITDVAVEWPAAIISGDVVVAPSGFWGSPLPAQTSFDISCGVKFQTQEGKIIEYTGSEINATDLSDQDFWKTLRANYKSYRVLPFTCDNQILIADNYQSAVTVAGESPGLVFSWTVPPDYVITSGENNLMQWFASMLIPTDGIVCRRYIPGLLDLFLK
jgi:hypothetical protein